MASFTFVTSRPANPVPEYATAPVSPGAGAGGGTIGDHLADADPHPQYLTPAEGNATYSLLGHTHTAANITDFASAVDTQTATNRQPLDADLTAIAALSTTAYGRGLLTLANATALANEVDSFFLTPAEGNAAYQPLDSELTALAGLTSAADRLPYFTGAGAASLATFTSFGRSLVDDADAAAGRTTLALGTIATQNASAVAITGGAIDGAAIGATTPAAGTFTSVIGGTGTSASAIYSNGAAGTVSDVGLLTNGSPRWLLRRGQGAESGSNAGSGFELLARSDAGALIDAPISIVRAAGGAITIARPMAFGANAVTGSAVTITGGAVDGTPIGATTQSTARFTTLGVNTAVTAGNELHVAGEAQFDSGNINFGGSGSAHASNPSLYRLGTAGSDDLIIAIGGSEKARLKSTGDLITTAIGSTTSAPRTVGIGDFASTRAARFQFGDPLNSFQAAFGGRMQFQSYWGIEIHGNRQSSTVLTPNTTGSDGDNYSLRVVGELRADGAIYVNSTTPVITSTRHPQLRSYAKASLPSAATAAQLIYVSDDVGGATPAFSDGTNWRRVSDRAVIA